MDNTIIGLIREDFDLHERSCWKTNIGMGTVTKIWRNVRAGNIAAEGDSVPEAHVVMPTLE